jgi:hypothetical protein
MIRARKRKIRERWDEPNMRSLNVGGQAERSTRSIRSRGSMLAAELSTVKRLNDQDSTSPPLRSPFESFPWGGGRKVGSLREALERCCERKGGALLTFH